MVTGVFQFPLDFQPLRDGAAGPTSEPFISGAENWLLHHTLNRLLAAPDNPIRAELATPLLVWGPAGTGKSMLLHGLAACWPARRRILPVPAADWAREGDLDGLAPTGADLSDSDLSDSDLSDNDRLDHNSDRQPAAAPITAALFVDDVHLLAGRVAAQRRLARAIDEFSNSAGIVVLTSRSHPAAASGLIPRLVSRLMGGLSMELHAPGPQARAVLVQKVAQRAGWLITGEAAAYAAQRFEGSVRELRQSLSRCFPVRPISRDAIGVRELAARLEACATEAIPPQETLKIVARHYGVPVAALKSASRRRSVVLARSVAMYLVRKTTSFPLKRIGQLFGGRDHTTVIHACRKIEQQIEHDTELHRFVSETTTRLRLRNTH